MAEGFKDHSSYVVGELVPLAPVGPSLVGELADTKERLARTETKLRLANTRIRQLKQRLRDAGIAEPDA